MRISSATTSVIAIGLGLIAGCSSSQPTTPATPSAISADPQVNATLEQSCFQCHSSTGSAPWYAAVSPTYLAANSARGVLNFSDWQSYDGERRAAEMRAIEHSVDSGSMPPGDYTMLDHSAQLSADQKQSLLKWAAQPAH
jgi:hypothetical protein